MEGEEYIQIRGAHVFTGFIFGCIDGNRSGENDFFSDDLRFGSLQPRDGAKEREDGTQNYAAGHLRSFKIEIRDTSRQLRRIKRKGGGLQNERRTSLWGL